MEELWRASNALAQELCGVEPVGTTAWAIAHWRHTRINDPVLEVIQESHRGESLERNPLWSGLEIARGPIGADLVEIEGGNAWLSAAVATAVAWARSIEWIRGKLPRYPQLLVPHIDRRANRSSPAGLLFGTSKPWPFQFRMEGPQLLARPNVSTIVSANNSLALVGRIRALAGLLQGTSEWIRFTVASEKLSNADEDALREICRQHRALIADEVVEQIDPTNMLRRFKYKDAVLQDVLESARGAAREYLDAFGAVDELISSVSRVVEHLVVFGPPESVGSVVDGVWEEREFGSSVRLVTSEAAELFMSPMMVEVECEISKLAGIVIGMRTSVNFHDLADEQFNASLEGILLPDSSECLSAGPAW